MGLNIWLQKLDGTTHPSWDATKFAGDRDILAITCAFDLIDEPDYDPWKKGDAPRQRPADPGDLFTIDLTLYPERWDQFRRILRDEPDYWIYWSV
jgi:hypothetical protein